MLGGGDNSDNAVAAFGLGGLIGSTYASVEKRINVKLHAYGPGSVEPPTGVYVCGVTPPPVVESKPAPAPAPEKVEAPKQAPEPQAKACNPEPIRKQIESLKVEISHCKVWGLNNEGLRFGLANAYANLAKCTGESGYFSDAIENYKLAEKNYLKGKDIKANRAEADQILAKAYWNWAAVIRERDGRDAENRFAYEKNMSRMPEGIREIKK
jgi:hypothetical protein